MGPPKKAHSWCVLPVKISSWSTKLFSSYKDLNLLSFRLKVLFTPPKFHIVQTPKGTSLHDFTSFELKHVKIHPRIWPVRWSKKKGINKNNFCYISPICPEGVFVRNLCIWVHLYEIWYRGLLADVINCADFFRLVQGYWFCKGLKFAYSQRNWRSPLTLSELLFRLWCKLNWAFQRTHYWIPTIQDSWDTPS